MGVGVSYNGRGGRQAFDLTGLPSGKAADLLGAPRKHHQLLPESFKKAKFPQPQDPAFLDKSGKVKLNAFDRHPDTLDKKLKPGSAVIASLSGVCLEGEEQNPVISGTKVYASHGGRKGYYSVEEMDPAVSSPRVGAFEAGGLEADPAVAKAGSPFAFQVVSRMSLETDTLGRLLLIEYDKDVENTALGRTHTVTGERRRVVGIIEASDFVVEFLHPYKVEAFQLNDDEYGYDIYLPAGSLMFNGREIPLGGDLANFDGFWYYIPKGDSAVSAIYLNLDWEGDELVAKISTDPLNVENESGCPKKVSILIARVNNDIVSQLVMSSISLLVPEVDDASVDLNDKNKLQLSGFDKADTSSPTDEDSSIAKDLSLPDDASEAQLAFPCKDGASPDGKLKWRKLGRLKSKRLIAGENIELTEVQDGLIISAPNYQGESPDGSSGVDAQIDVVSSVTWNDESIVVAKKRLTFVNGRLVAVDDTAGNTISTVPYP